MFESTPSVIILFNMFGAGVGTVLSASLLTLPSVRQTVRWLGALILCISTAMMCINLDHAGYFDNFPIVFLEYLCGVVYGPIVYAFTRGSVGGSQRPLAWVAAGFAGIVVLATGSIRLLMVTQFVFTSLSLITFARRSPYCNPDDVYWARRLLTGAVLLHVAQIARLMSATVSSLREIVPLTATMIGVGFCCLALRRSFGKRQESPATPKYERSPIPQAAATEQLRRLEELMDTAKLYRRSDLTLGIAAEELGLTPHILSQLLNQYAGQTFGDYLNRFRVDEVRRRLIDSSNDHLTIEGLGQEAGFRSRSGFYAAFRKFAGMSPNEFRKKTRLSRSDSTNTQ